MNDAGSHRLIFGDLDSGVRDDAKALEIRRTSLPAIDSPARQPLDPWLDEVRAVAGLQTVWRGLPARRTLLFPVSTSPPASMLAVRMAKVLASLNRSPVLLVDLYTEGDRAYQIGEELQDHPGAAFFMPSAHLPSDALPLGSASVTVMALAQEPDPLELLASERFAAVIRQSSARCGTVLVNGPSPGDSAASLLAAPHCNGCILLIEEGVSKVEDIQQASALMRRIHCEILGFFYLAAGRAGRRKMRAS